MSFIEKIKIAQAFAGLPLVSLGQGIADDYESGDDDASFYAALNCWDSNGGTPRAVVSEAPGPATSSVHRASPGPDRRNIAAFVLTLFKHATPGNWVSLRAFPDQGGNSKPFKITPIKLNGGLDALIDRAYQDAEFAACCHEKVVFCPPIATFTNPNHAREQDLAEGFTLSVECDAHPRAARAKLEQLLGPPTMVVKSGGAWTNPETGEVEPKLHDHYRLEAPARSKDDQQKLKQARKLAAKLVGGDPTSASIVHPIRWPGSLHRKREPKPCRIIACNPDAEIDLDSALEILQRAAGDAVSRSNGKGAQQPIAEKFKGLDPRQGLGQGVEPLPPLPFEPIKAECAWLREAFETGGEKFSEPQWNLTTLAATFLENGRDYADAFGKQHPDYSPEITEKKWDEKIRARRENPAIGWPQCKTIHEAQLPGPSLCQQCPHFAKGKSPLNIGHEAARDEIDNEEMRLLGGTRPADLRLPEGFCLDEKGRVCRFFPTRVVGKKVYQGRLEWLISNRIGAPSLQFQNGHFGIGFTASTDLKGTTEVFLTSAQCYKDGLLKQLAAKCVMYNPGKEPEALVEKFAVGWMIKLKAEDTAIRDHGIMGWRYQDSKIVGFVYGSALYHEDGSETPIVRATDDEFRSHYMPVGTKDAWLQAARLLTDRKRPELDIIISVGFAAPLMTFAGALYGALLSIFGEPGSSKSSGQQVAAAIWGSPKQTRESLNSTPKSVQRRLGLIKNLPAYWDDIQDERHQEALFNTLFVATQGTEGGRLNTDASYKERLEWQTLLVVCANASFVEYLVKKQKSTTAGMRRVLEFKFDKKDNEPGIVDATDASKIFGALEHNFGRVGAEYARLLATEHAAIGVMVDDITKDFMQEVDGSGDENYWWGMCGVLLAGATLANRLGAELDVPAMRAFLIEAFYANRKTRGVEGTEGGSYQNTEQSLVAFLNFYVGGGNAIYTDKMFVHKNIKVTEVFPPGLNHPIYVQVARDQRLIVVSKRAMREYFDKYDIQAKGVFDGLMKYFNAKEMRHTLGAGTVYAQAQERCIEIPVHDDQQVLHELLTAHGEPR